MEGLFQPLIATARFHQNAWILRISMAFVQSGFGCRTTRDALPWVLAGSWTMFLQEGSCGLVSRSACFGSFWLANRRRIGQPRQLGRAAKLKKAAVGRQGAIPCAPWSPFLGGSPKYVPRIVGLQLVMYPTYKLVQSSPLFAPCHRAPIMERGHQGRQPPTWGCLFWLVPICLRA